MVSAITEGVQVSVLVQYQPEYSNPYQAHFVFAYRIKIINKSEYTVQILHRHWHIADANTHKRQVTGEGVVGQQPTLEAGESYEYISACNLGSSIGKMYGTYLAERLVDGKKFQVKIPEFTLMVPFRWN